MVGFLVPLEHAVRLYLSALETPYRLKQASNDTTSFQARAVGPILTVPRWEGVSQFAALSCWGRPPRVLDLQGLEQKTCPKCYNASAYGIRMTDRTDIGQNYLRVRSSNLEPSTVLFVVKYKFQTLARRCHRRSTSEPDNHRIRFCWMHGGWKILSIFIFDFFQCCEIRARYIYSYIYLHIYFASFSHSCSS